MKKFNLWNLFFFIFFFKIKCFTGLESLYSIFERSSESMTHSTNIYSHIDRLLIPNYDKYNEPTKFIYRKNQVFERNLQESPTNTSNNLIEENKEEESRRFCNNVGFLINITRKNFYCEGIWTDEQTFNDTMLAFYNNNLTNNTNDNDTNISSIYDDSLFENITNKSSLPCYKNLTVGKVCFCPHDYYGDYCNFHNDIVCSLTYIPPFKCPYYNSFYYVSDYGGDEPCQILGKKRKLNISVNVKCYNSRPELLYEGVKVDFDYLPINYSETNINPFLYYIYEDNLISTYSFKVKPLITLVDWNSLTNSLIFPFRNLFLFEIKGEYPVRIPIDFSNISSLYRLAGRYYVDIKMMSDNQGKNVPSPVAAYIYFDDSNYIEPKAKILLNTKSIIVIVVLSVCFGIAVGIGLYCYYKKKKQKQKKLKDEMNENLFILEPY